MNTFYPMCPRRKRKEEEDDDGKVNLQEYFCQPQTLQGITP
jgi:hypothetical protein